MAPGNEDTPQTPKDASDSINRLRTIAVNHLKEIDQDIEQELKAEAKKNEELERYTRRRRVKGDTATTSSQAPTPKMRSAEGKSWL